LWFGYHLSTTIFYLKGGKKEGDVMLVEESAVKDNKGIIIGYVRKEMTNTDDEKVTYKCLCQGRIVKCTNNAVFGFGVFAGIPLTYCADHRHVGQTFAEQLLRHKKTIDNIELKGYYLWGVY
jgi:hypothetical protein